MRKIYKNINTLANLKVGEKAIVVKLNNKNREIRRYLLDMGITKGTEVKVKKIALMGDPVDILLRGYKLCLRRKDLEEIEVELIK